MAQPVVHLELRTDNLARACAFYTQLFGWRAETVHAGAASYLALDLGAAIRGGVSEREREHPAWLPYVEVRDAEHATERGRLLGAAVTLQPRRPGGLAQRAGPARRRTDRPLATEAVSRPRRREAR